MNEQTLAGWVRAHYYSAADHTHESRGSLDRFRPVRLNASGLIDPSMLTGAAGDFDVGGALTVTKNGLSLALIGTDHTYQGFYPDGVGAGRKAYFGYPSDSNDNLVLAQEITTAHIQLAIGSSIFLEVEDSGAVRANYGSLLVGSASAAADTSIELGYNRVGSGYSYIDLIGDTTYSDYGLRVIRGNAGANAVSEILHRGTGVFSLKTIDAAQLSLYTNSTERFRIDSSGNVAVRHASGANLYVTGTAANVTSALSLYDNGSTLKGRFIYTGGNSAGNRYVGIINDAADYIGLIGHVRASAGVNVGGDSGGVASTLGLTNAFSGVSTGTGTVKMNGATSRNSVGWVKMYNGTTAIYLPYWTTITG